MPAYLRRLEATEGTDLQGAAAALREALRGDCHVHSDWSDGGSPIEEMALAAVELGHEYMVLTDHSPRLTVARGLPPARLRRQLDHVAKVNEALPEGFRILTGIEVDILENGSLDQEDELLARLDVVVGSVHSKLRDESAEDDPADADRDRQPAPGHPRPHDRPQGVGRGGRRDRRGRPRAPARQHPAAERLRLDKVLAACVEHGKAVEINCRPDRLDPPKRMLTAALEAGCLFSIDTDAHAPGPARLAAVRLRTRGDVRGAGRPGGQHLAGGPAAGVDRHPQALTIGSPVGSGRGTR